MIGLAAERLMGLEAGAATGAADGERDPARRVQRNGWRDRDREARAGSVDLRFPKPRKRSCFPGFLEPRRVAEKARTAVMHGSYRTDTTVCPRGMAFRGHEPRVGTEPVRGWGARRGARVCPARRRPVPVRPSVFLIAGDNSHDPNP